MDPGPASPTSPRPRSRGFSFRSDKSGGSKGKIDLTESPKDKLRRDSIWKGTSKANPNAAMNEAQPQEINQLEQATIESLRNLQHKDAQGNVITDPDLSNPTRPRMERPLETIQSFERQIAKGYERRSMRVDTYDQRNQYASRRSSYFGGYDSGQNGNRYSQVGGGGGGYYGNRRPDSYADGPNGPPPRPMRYGQRMQSDPTGMRSSGVYPQHGYHQSYDTVMSGQTHGSDSTGPWANSTDPSSENSSLEKMAATTKPYGPADVYAANGYSPSNAYPIPEEQAAGYYGEGYPPQNGYGGPVQPPNGQRRPIPLGGGQTAPMIPQTGKLPPPTRREPEKKKSWLQRRFSKKE